MARQTLRDALEAELESAGLASDARIVVAFSGGPDSAALLQAAIDLRPATGLDPIAIHLDHGLDGESRHRHRRAERLAHSLGVDFVGVRREVAPRRRAGESLEAASRRIRYDFLEEQRARTDSALVATAHHRDDQIETLLLRLLFGSGLEGLAGIRARRGRLWRPFLSLPGSTLRASVANLVPTPTQDVTNSDPRQPRSRIRHYLLPRLLAEEPTLGTRILSLGQAAGRLRRSLRRRLGPLLDARPELRGASATLEALLGLPSELYPSALSLLHHTAGAPHPASSAARAELQRQLERDLGVGCDAGGGWRWRAREGRLFLEPPANAPTSPFTYTLRVPGEVEIRALRRRFRLRRGPIGAWAFQTSAQRAALDLPLENGDPVIIRSRRPGDRIRPLGCTYTKRLKKVLIDAKIPRETRDQLPLLCLGNRVVWVPGVTLSEDVRLPGGATHGWICEIFEA